MCYGTIREFESNYAESINQQRSDHPDHFRACELNVSLIERAVAEVEQELEVRAKLAYGDPEALTFYEQEACDLTQKAAIRNGNRSRFSRENLVIQARVLLRSSPKMIDILNRRLNDRRRPTDLADL